MPPRNEAPFTVQVPLAGEDRPAWVKVGVIAAVGFAIGIAWPRVAGIRLGPSAPGESTAATAAASRAPDAPSAAPVSIASAPVAAEPQASAPLPVAPSGPPTVAVTKGIVVSCRTEDNENIKGSAACGGLSGIDAFAQPRIRRLSACTAADGAAGKLAFTLFVDFNLNRVGTDIAKSSTVPNVESIGNCLKQQFGGILPLGAIEHTHPRYSVVYNTSFTLHDAQPPGQATATLPPSATGSPAAMPVDAPTAAVVWEVAIVRDTPRTGQVVARLQRGTKIHVGNSQEGWYRVRYGNGFSTEGWVYRGAIGR